jgi:ankyrin repeat protein
MASRRLPNDAALTGLMHAISAADRDEALRRLAEAPELARASLTSDAAFDRPRASYVGDTALHIAAAAHQPEIARTLIGLGAGVRARNRRGAEPLHYAAVGQPGSPVWNPEAQAAVIAILIAAGADPNGRNMDGATALHRAVRTRSLKAVEALLAHGADIHALNGGGSDALLLVEHNTGRSGSGSPEAKAQQEAIRILLHDRIASGRSA